MAQTKRKIVQVPEEIMRQPTTPQNEEETKRDRFIRIGNARMNRVIHSIHLLGNMGNSNYESTEEDVRAMQNSIIDELGKVIERMSKTVSKRPTAFTFEGVDDL